MQNANFHCFLKTEIKLKVFTCFSVFRTLKITFTENMFKGKIDAIITPAQ